MDRGPPGCRYQRRKSLFCFEHKVLPPPPAVFRTQALGWWVVRLFLTLRWLFNYLSGLVLDSRASICKFILKARDPLPKKKGLLGADRPIWSCFGRDTGATAVLGHPTAPAAQQPLPMRVSANLGGQRPPRALLLAWALLLSGAKGTHFMLPEGGEEWLAGKSGPDVHGTRAAN